MRSKANHPSTSIMVCSYNMEAWVDGALRSVLSQTSDDWECLFIDDGSTDQTQDQIAAFKKDARFRFWKNEKRAGLTQCRNEMLAAARGRWISILDADDLLFPHKTASHQDAFEKDPRTGIVWGRALILENDTFTAVPEFDFIPSWDLSVSYCAAHSATTWRKDLVLALGGYEEAFELVEAPNLFLKVGDSHRQTFVDEFAAIKRTFPQNEFRTQLTEEKKKRLSQKLKQATISRRFGISYSP